MLVLVFIYDLIYASWSFYDIDKDGHSAVYMSIVVAFCEWGYG